MTLGEGERDTPREREERKRCVICEGSNSRVLPNKSPLVEREARMSPATNESARCFAAREDREKTCSQANWHGPLIPPPASLPVSFGRHLRGWLARATGDRGHVRHKTGGGMREAVFVGGVVVVCLAIRSNG